jgi:hypothetical protein
MKPRSIAAALMHFVMLAELQILRPGWRTATAGKTAAGRGSSSSRRKRGAKSYRKNNRCNIHGTFLSSSEVKQMKNKENDGANFLLTIRNRPVAIRRKTFFPFLPVSLAV